MKVSANFILTLISLLFVSCGVEETIALEGTWKVIKVESEFVMETDPLYNGIQQYALELWEPDHWTFYGDSIMQSRYPYYAKYFQTYKIVDEEYILTADSYDDMIFSKRFSGDTLILKRRDPKYFETFYLLEQDVSAEQIALLKSDKVDWTHYLRQWQFDEFIKSAGRKCNPNFPEMLDLSESNSRSFGFDKNILKYRENDTLNRFEFSSAFNDEINFKHICDSGCENQWVGYKK